MNHGRRHCYGQSCLIQRLFLVVLLLINWANEYGDAFCNAFQLGPLLVRKIRVTKGTSDSRSPRSNARILVAMADPSRGDAASVRPPTRKAPPPHRPKPARGRGRDSRNSNNGIDPQQAVSMRSSRPEQVEEGVLSALQTMRSNWSMHKDSGNSTVSPVVLNMLLFPTVRECNAALAAFGDDGELLRALRLFGKMRKAVMLQQVIQRQTGLSWPVPTPTLVTYSTLMSRAVKASKPRVALRLWKIKGSDLKADLKAANILMVRYVPWRCRGLLPQCRLSLYHSTESCKELLRETRRRAQRSRLVAPATVRSGPGCSQTPSQPGDF